jgi:tRNA (mo5U34)-methyltransferase
MNTDLKAEIARYTWWHSIDLGNGLITPGHKTPQIHAEEVAAYFDGVDLAGKSVIDIGAWNGFYSFEAKRRGASRVVAADSYAWTHPKTDGRKSFDFANRVTGLNVEPRLLDIEAPLPGDIGTFDIVLFLGVFYHLKNAITGLQNAARLAKELLIVETELDLYEVGRPAMAFYPGSELGGDATNWWGPNKECVIALLKDCGFAHIESMRASVHTKRGIFHAWRSKDLSRRKPAPAELRIP